MGECGLGVACGHIEVFGLFPFPHLRNICSEGLQGQHASSKLGRTLHHVLVLIAITSSNTHTHTHTHTHSGSSLFVIDQRASKRVCVDIRLSRRFQLSLCSHTTYMYACTAGNTCTCIVVIPKANPCICNYLCMCMYNILLYAVCSCP